jgi:hypothetical protein
MAAILRQHPEIKMSFLRQRSACFETVLLRESASMIGKDENFLALSRFAP